MTSRIDRKAIINSSGLFGTGPILAQLPTTTETPAEASRIASQLVYMAKSGAESYGERAPRARRRVFSIPCRCLSAPTVFPSLC